MVKHTVRTIDANVAYKGFARQGDEGGVGLAAYGLQCAATRRSSVEEDAADGAFEQRVSVGAAL